MVGNKEAETQQVPDRSEIPENDQWDISALYADDSEWESDFEKIEPRLCLLEGMKGKLDVPERVLEFLREETKLDRLSDRLYVYAHLASDQNTADTQAQARLSRIATKLTETDGRLAWADPELLGCPEDILREWIRSDLLADFRYPLTRLLRRKAHTLSEPEEKILSMSGEIFSAPGRIYTLLTNADMKFPDVPDEDGNMCELSQGRFHRFLINPVRSVRRAAFEGIYDTYSDVRNTVACSLAKHVRTHNLLADIRKYESALEAALSADNIPVGLYTALLDSVHTALPRLFQYLKLRKKCLELEKLGMHDLHVPIVPDVEIEIPFSQAREWVLEACAPLGQEYLDGVDSAFKNRWIDVYENRGKRSGAYSSGCYDSMPYVLLNYQGTLDDAFTLAHELGHSMHSLLSNRNQPPQTADYPIFTAEIASTLNEGLLLRYLLEQREDPHFRAYLFNKWCDGFRGTVYRQSMFAEFELKIHEMDAGGEPLTFDLLSEEYGRLNEQYHGSSVDPGTRIAWEWARIPHFYYNFYVYKYATSFCASEVFVNRLLDSTQARDRYLDLLRAGGSADPLDLIKEAGVDLSNVQTLNNAFEQFSKTTERLRETLGEIDELTGPVRLQPY